MNNESRIKEIEREIEATKTDISWSDDNETISILEEKIDALNLELTSLEK